MNQLVTQQLSAMPEFERERMLRLHELCEEIALWVANGTPLQRCWEEACKEHAGAMLPAGLHRGEQQWRELKLSVGTLRGYWYRWIGERSPLAFRRDWKPGKDRMPAELVQEFRRRCTLEGQRHDSVSYRALVRDWREGKVVPGLGSWQEWYAAEHPEWAMPSQAPEFPFSYSSLQRRAPKGALRALGNEGVAAMRRAAPHVIMDYSQLRPAELYISDDARLDILAIDDLVGKATVVTIYLMMEVSCRLITAYVMRPANAINAADVDEMIKRGLQAGGLGDGYVTHLKFERGTVAMSVDKQELLERWSEGKIQVHRTSMDGGKRWEGAAPDKASGHWMGKAVIESFVRKLHLALMDLPGQTGNRYEVRPANLMHSITRSPTGAGPQGDEPVRKIAGGVAEEAERLAQLDLQFGNRLKLKLPLLTVTQLNGAVRDAINRHNSASDHKYQDFEAVTEAEVQPGVWRRLDEIGVKEEDK